MAIDRYLLARAVNAVGDMYGERRAISRMVRAAGPFEASGTQTASQATAAFRRSLERTLSGEHKSGRLSAGNEDRIMRALERLEVQVTVTARIDIQPSYKGGTAGVRATAIDLSAANVIRRGYAQAWVDALGVPLAYLGYGATGSVPYEAEWGDNDPDEAAFDLEFVRPPGM